MPVLLAQLVNMLRIMLMAKAGAMVAKILTFLGITIVVSTFAVDPLLNDIRAMIQAGPGGGLGADVLAWAGVLKFDIALSMMLGAYSAAWSIRSAKAAVGITTNAN